MMIYCKKYFPIFHEGECSFYTLNAAFNSLGVAKPDRWWSWRLPFQPKLALRVFLLSEVISVMGVPCQTLKGHIKGPRV